MPSSARRIAAGHYEFRGRRLVRQGGVWRVFADRDALAAGDAEPVEHTSLRAAKASVAAAGFCEASVEERRRDQRTARVAERRRRLLASGICPSCKGPMDRDGVQCAECTAYTREHMRATRAASRPPVADHYILDIRSTEGNCALWWRPNSRGHTCDLDDAGLYTREFAEGYRETDVPVPRALAERLVVRHVPLDRLKQELELAGHGREEERCA